MKKFFILFFLSLFIIFLMPSAYAFAAWQSHYNGNPHYPIVYGFRQVAKYIDKTSLYVQSYQPPYYIISVAVFYADDNGYGKMHNYHVSRFYYDYDRLEMYYDKKVDKGDWTYIYPEFSFTENGNMCKTGEAAFYLAYRIPFYGSRKWKIPHSNTYIDLFDQEFYQTL